MNEQPTALRRTAIVAGLVLLTLLAIPAGLVGFFGLWANIDTGAPLHPGYVAICYSVMLIAVVAPITAWLIFSWKLWVLRLALAATPTMYAALFVALSLTSVLDAF